MGHRGSTKQKNGIDCGRDLSVEQSILKKGEKMKCPKVNSIFLVIGVAVLTIALGLILFKPSITSKIGRDRLAERFINPIQTKTIMPESTTYVYLIHPMIDDVKIVYRIKIHNKYLINYNVIEAQPIFTDIYGKAMVIPLHNIRAIVKGNNKFKEHILE